MEEREVGYCLGYDEVLSLDADPSEGAEIIYDLNTFPSPPGLRERFDCVVNAGTMEHVFHLPHFLANTFMFLKTGGIIIHVSPMHNMVEHGFFQISPTLFWDYYSSNGFDIGECLIVKHHFEGEKHKFETVMPFNSFEHSPDPLYGKLDSGIYDVMFIARKNQTSTYHVIPTQYRYQR